MAANYQASPLGLPSQDERNDAEQRILSLRERNRQSRSAASAELWVEGSSSNPYVGDSNRDVTICAEQACTNQLGGIFPSLSPGQYSRIFLFHIKGEPPCGRCAGQFLALSQHQHPIRVWWGRINVKDQPLPLKYTDFVNGQQYDV